MATRVMAKLTPLKISKLKEPGNYGDGRGLYLQITKEGYRSWLHRFELNGVEKAMGLGPCCDISLEMAREKASTNRRMLLEGVCPLTTARETREAERKGQRRR